MCESKVELDGKVVVNEAAKIEVNEDKITVYDIVGERKEIENAKVVEIDFIGHTTKIAKND